MPTTKTTTKSDIGPVEAELRRIADREVPRLTRVVKRAVQRVRDSVPADTIAVEPDFDRMLLLTIEKNDEDTDNFDEVLIAIMVAAAAAAGGDLDVEDPFVLTRIERDIGNMVVGVRRSSQDAIARAVAQMAGGSMSQAEGARIIRSVIGLNARQAKALLSYREALLRLAEGRGTAARVRERWKLANGDLSGSLTQARIDRLVRQYGDRLLDDRAAAIARTETVRAVNAGRFELWRQQQDEGLLPTSAKKVWRTAFDERVCPVCAPLDGRVMALSDSFFGSNAVAALYPPIHTRCRCWLALEV